ncbi:MAG: hypothetical protein COB36_03100 [Alphaproteobacteria bacterium]|nr:MAG: hypothetical protein COB36_03100 [Alphaproteobacteria bacterium]
MKIKNLKRWLPLVVITLLMVIAYASGLHEKLSLHALQENKDTMLNMVAERPILTAVGFMAVYIIFVALSLPAATLLTLMGGFLFGTWLGTLYVVTAATIGATIIFLIAKTSLGVTLREKAGGMYKRIEDNMKDNATGYLLFMRLIPVFPFFLVNIVPALFNVKPRIFILTTFFGIIPGSFVYVNLGQQLADIESLNDLISIQTLLAFSLLGLFALIPTLYKQLKNRKTSVALVVACLLAFPQNSHAGAEYQKFLSLYDSLLSAYVTPVKTGNIAYNGVNYDSWASDQRHKQALALLLAEDPNAYQDNDEKAFWINAYNFLTIELIVRENERSSIKNLGSLFTNPWKKHSWALAKHHYTLNHIEHKILRPMNDARIHFAINCASISCPDLQDESYRAENLNAQLNDQVRLTLNNAGKGLHIGNDTIYVSKIFKWFAADFKNGDIKGWLTDYQPINQNHDLRFMEYDWSLNKMN